MPILYYLVLKPISILPRWARYLLSDAVSFILKDIVRYRRTLVETQLKHSFPGLHRSEHARLVKGVYANVGDVMIEAIRAFSMKEKDALLGLELTGMDVLQELFNDGRDVILTGGHFANWEAICWGGHRIPHDVYALYKPLKNNFMDTKVKSSRSRFGVEMISVKEYETYMTEEHDVPRLFIFGIDQSPKKSSSFSMEFLNRETKVFTGPERLSKRFDMAVVTGRLMRKSRGRYSVGFKLLYENPRYTDDGVITLSTMKDVEELVLQRPEDWLWTHNRWKHSPKPND